MIGAGDLAPFYVHGGRVAEARAVFGGEDWIDLSTGIAPRAYPVGETGLARLPESGAVAALEAAAARAFGVPGARAVVAVPGTDLAMRLLALLMPGERPAVVVPGYGGHRAAWPAAVPIAWEALGQGGHDLTILASPANPDGRRLDPVSARDLLARGMLVVDEAYADPAPGLAAMDDARLVVLRSFGKFYGLPGVRLGFVIAAPALADALRALLGDWPVSGPAVTIGTQAYGDTAWQVEQVRRIGDAAVALDAVLDAAGFAVSGRAGLFRLVAVPGAGRLFRHLAERAILVRPLADQPDRLRIGLPGDEAAVRRLADALQEFKR